MPLTFPSERKRRLFIALPVSEELRQIYAHWLKEAQSTLKLPKVVRWIPPENLHLTLRFLGPVEESRIPEVEKAMTMHHDSPEFTASGPLDLVYEKLGTFPVGRFPRVIWIGLDEAGEGFERLKNWEKELDLHLAQIGFPRDPAEASRGFHPHLTVARVQQSFSKDRESSDPKTLIQNWVKERKDFRLGSVVVSKATLFESQTLPTGAVYRSISTADLA